MDTSKERQANQNDHRPRTYMAPNFPLNRFQEILPQLAWHQDIEAIVSSPYYQLARSIYDYLSRNRN